MTIVSAQRSASSPWSTAMRAPRSVLSVLRSGVHSRSSERGTPAAVRSMPHTSQAMAVSNSAGRSKISTATRWTGLPATTRRRHADILAVAGNRSANLFRPACSHARSVESDPATVRSVRWMSRLQFGSFLAPHHPTGDNPTLQLQRDLELVTHLDRLGYDEFWCGEHHSSGWETIASPEMFLACAGQVSSTIRLGTGVVSLPYHHPFNVAQRIVQLDRLTRGRAMFGSGPGALPSDARTFGIDPVLLRDRQDEALGVIIRLLRGEPRFSYACDWFELQRLRAATAADPGRHADGDGVFDLAVGDADRRQVRDGCAVDRVPLDGGDPRPSDTVGIRRRGRGSQRDGRRSRQLAGVDGVPHRRDPGAGAGRSRRRAAPLAQRVQRVDARPARRVRTSRTSGSCSIRRPGPI